MPIIKEIVSALIKRYKTNDPFKIADLKGIRVAFEPLGNTLGYHSMYKRIHTIHINCDVIYNMQRFVCAHELGHAILHPKINTLFLRHKTYFYIPKIEREANEFAVHILLPDQEIYNWGCNARTFQEAAAVYGIPQEFIHLKE